MTLIQHEPTVATNVATIKQWVTAMAKGDLDHAPYQDDAELSDPNGKYKGKAQIVESFKTWQTAFPNGSAEVTNQIALGDQVASEVVYKATHSGPLATASGSISPTNKPIELTLMILSSFRDGLIQRERAYFDRVGLMRQLGITVPPKA
ncbi:MAG TPA: ester cyclase [Candidatus Limnocylindria bacterium]